MTSIAIRAYSRNSLRLRYVPAASLNVFKLTKCRPPIRRNWTSDSHHQSHHGLYVNQVLTYLAN